MRKIENETHVIYLFWDDYGFQDMFLYQPTFITFRKTKALNKLLLGNQNYLNLYSIVYHVGNKDLDIK